MTYSLKLRYGALLLELIRREGRWGRTINRPLLFDLCDRFERLMASIPAHPILWEGDGA